MSDIGTSVFRKSWLDNCYVSRQEAMELCKGHRWALCIDSAWKRQETKGTGDDTTMGIVGYDRDAMPYLIDLFVSNTISEAQGMEEMAAFLGKYPQVSRIIKERKPGEASNFPQNWRRFCKSRGYRYIAVTEPPRPGSAIVKENRIRGLAPHFEMGEFYIVESVPHIDAFVKQYTQYAGEGSGKDDILDMLADAAMIQVRPAAPIEDNPRNQWNPGYRPIPTVSDNMVGNAPPIGARTRAGWASLKGRL